MNHLQLNKLEKQFGEFRKYIIGNETYFTGPYGEKKILYADWTASGKLYEKIESYLRFNLGQYMANTHTETTETGTKMTKLYHVALKDIKRHVNANEKDVIIPSGPGMTSAINKFQRMLGIQLHEKWKPYVTVKEEEKPVVFITHMEHHSNQISWEECMVEVVIVQPDEKGLVSPNQLRKELEKYKHRKFKFGSFTACSNVTGITVPYHQMAKVMHEYDGYCFVDFSASAPYVNMNMHPIEEGEHLDAIFFAPHKFLGGPGSTGILIFNKELYTNKVPDQPGGGTVSWTNPWNEKGYYSDIEVREDGGTPGILQVIQTALAIKLKEKMGVENILQREHELTSLFLKKMKEISSVYVLDSEHQNRLGIVSFYSSVMNHNLFVRILNDKYGIQTRGGCSCAGTYGHYLLSIDRDHSKRITDEIDKGNCSVKPGWVRVSFHPTMTNKEVEYIAEAIQEIVENVSLYKKEYVYEPLKNEYFHVDYVEKEETLEDIV